MSRLMIDRRTFLSGAMALGAATSAPAWASDAPITLIVPFAAGGPTDIVARLAAEGMARRLMRPIIVENVGGAGGATGTLRAARARPDGSVMVLGQMATHALTPLLNANAGYDPVADFEPIGIAATAPMVLAARKGLPAGSLARRVPGPYRGSWRQALLRPCRAGRDLASGLRPVQHACGRHAGLGRLPGHRARAE